MYSSTLSLTSALDGVDGQRHTPVALPPGKTRYSLYRRLGGPLGSVWTGVENLTQTGFRWHPLNRLQIERKGFKGRDMFQVFRRRHLYVEARV